MSDLFKPVGSRNSCSAKKGGNNELKWHFTSIRNRTSSSRYRVRIVRASESQWDMALQIPVGYQHCKYHPMSSRDIYNLYEWLSRTLQCWFIAPGYISGTGFPSRSVRWKEMIRIRSHPSHILPTVIKRTKENVFYFTIANDSQELFWFVFFGFESRDVFPTPSTPKYITQVAHNIDINIQLIYFPYPPFLYPELRISKASHLFKLINIWKA